MSAAAPFLLTNPDFSKMQVVKAYAHTVVAPAIDYWRMTIDNDLFTTVFTDQMGRGSSSSSVCLLQYMYCKWWTLGAPGRATGI